MFFFFSTEPPERKERKPREVKERQADKNSELRSTQVCLITYRYLLSIKNFL
jgi:hypothetical protein